MRWIIAVPVLLVMALSFVAPAFAALGDQSDRAYEYPAPVAPVNVTVAPAATSAPVIVTSSAGAVIVREYLDLRTR